MLIYIVIIAIILLAAIFSARKNDNTFLFWLLAAMLAMLSAVRYKVGTDYMGYVLRFGYVEKNISDGGFEIGCLWLVKLIIFFGGNVQIFFAITSIFIGAAVGYTICKNVIPEYRIFTLYIYICSTVYFGTMNLVRQYFAIAILMFGIELLKKKKYLQYLACILAASLFHTSAIFMLPYLFLIFMNDKKKANIVRILNITIFVSIIFMFIDLRPFAETLINIVPERYAGYLTDGYFRNSFFEARNSSAMLKCIVPTALWFFTYYNRARLKEKFQHVDLYLIGWAIYVIINNMFYGINIFIRVYTLFEYFSIYIVPIAISAFNKKTNRRIAAAFIVVYYIALTSYGIFYKNGNGVIPYDTIFGNKMI